eukprot:TRINITY_DN13541_c0_g1_i1.p1 TRINITY_DN13541_c0_g1~~TRINITY_DN13541_c0_g1_i1.p1  ORF type:complete len:229 (-),score=20.14 TRINITY_DN13541_c0_g1_i1:27-713(-)
MFIGHFAIAFFLSSFNIISNEVSLGYLLLASQWADVLWPIFCLTGIELSKFTPYKTPFNALDLIDVRYSHSLIGMFICGLLLALSHYLIRQRKRAVMVILLSVMSHWILDVMTHTPDMGLTLSDDTVKFGFGLWHYPVYSMGAEFVLFCICVGSYVSETKAVSRRGSWGLVVLVGLLVGSFLGTSPDPDPEMGFNAFLVMCIVSLLLVSAWGHWADTGRVRRKKTMKQ